MKLHLAVFALAIAPILATAKPAEAVTPELTGMDMSQPQTVNRASSHDRHHHRHAKVRHHHHQVAKHRSQH